MKKSFSFIIIFTFISLSYISIQAQRIDRQNYCSERLKLSDAQQKEFNDIRFNHQELRIELTSKLKLNRLELKKIFASSDINESKILDIDESASEIKAELSKARTKMWLSVYKILDKDQKLIWIKDFKRFGNKMNYFSKLGRHDKHRFNKFENGRHPKTFKKQKYDLD